MKQLRFTRSQKRRCIFIAAYALVVFTSRGFAEGSMNKEDSMASYARQKAKVTSEANIPPAMRLTSGPDRGITIVRTGMYWRDISNWSVDFDSNLFSYDLYSQGEKPLVGHRDLDTKTVKRLVKISKSCSKHNSRVGSDHRNAAWPCDIFDYGAAAAAA